MRSPLLLALFSILLALSPDAQAWRSALYPADWQPPTAGAFETDKVLQDFSHAGYRSGEVPPPVIAGPIFDATKPPYNADKTGAADATVAIQNAINAAQSAGGGVVFLPAGTYAVSPQGSNNYALRINASNVVLRGAGTSATFVLNTSNSMRSKSIILVQGPSAAGFYSSGTTAVNITADLPGPTRQIPVASTTPFAVGNWVVVRCDIGDAWINEHREPGWLGYGATLRGMAYYRRIVAIDSAAKVLTLDAPTRYYLKTRDGARVVKTSTALLSEGGLEDFSIGNVQRTGNGWGEEDYTNSANASYFTHDSWVIRFERARDCWLRRVASYQPAGNTTTCHLLSNGLLLAECRGVSAIDCHFQRPQYGGGGGNGYMYRIQQSNECLLDACRATFSRHGVVFSHMASSGNVIHACIDKDSGRQTGDTGSQTAGGKGSDHHMYFSHSNLIDVCTGDGSWWEARYRPYGSVPLHNLTSAHSVFWNTNGIGSSGDGAVVRTEQSRYGYAIGTRGTRTAIDRPTLGGSKCDPADHVEGVGLGETLEPFSLYEDQRIRRLGLPEVALATRNVLPFPRNSVALNPAVLVGRKSAAASSYVAQWRSVSGPAAVQFSDPATAATAATFPLRGTYVLEVSITANGTTAVAQTTVVLESYASRASTEFLPVADTYVSGGAFANDNYGAATSLLIRDDGGTEARRRAFLRFDLAPLKGASVLSAVLRLVAPAPPSAPATRTCEARFVASDSWSENATTWNTQPAMGALLTAWSPARDGLEMLDVRASAAAELAGDGQFSVGLQVTAQPAGELYSYVAREGAAANRPRLLVDYAVPAVGFDDWIAGFPAIPPDLRTGTADPDADALTNFAEFFLRTNPESANASPIAVTAAAGEIRIEFPQNPQLPPDASYFLESSTTLAPGSWKLLPGVTFDAAADSSGVLRMTARIPADPTAARNFYRIVFVIPP